MYVKATSRVTFSYILNVQFLNLKWFSMYFL